MKTIFSFCIFLSLMANPILNDYALNELAKFFNNKEVKKLYNLVDRFDEQIITNFGEKDLNEAYAVFFNSVAKTKTSDDFLKSISFLDKVKILEKVDKEVLTRIWDLDIFGEEKTFEIIGIKTKGPYVDFLMSTGKENPIIKEYIEAIIVAGDVNPYSVGLMRIKAKDLNINDKNIRLILAVHYLSIGKNLIK